MKHYMPQALCKINTTPTHVNAVSLIYTYVFQEHLHTFKCPGALGTSFSADGAKSDRILCILSVGKRWPLQKRTCCWTKVKVTPIVQCTEREDYLKGDISCSFPVHTYIWSFY